MTPGGWCSGYCGASPTISGALALTAGIMIYGQIGYQPLTRPYVTFVVHATTHKQAHSPSDGK